MKNKENKEIVLLMNSCSFLHFRLAFQFMQDVEGFHLPSEVLQSSLTCIIHEHLGE